MGLVGLSLVVGLAGCSGDDPRSATERALTSSPSPSSPSTPMQLPETSESAAPAPPAVPEASFRYVALGDSFTAAPLVPTTDPTDPCLRSDSNYPSLVTAALPSATLVDVSCGGADSDSMTRPQEVGGQKLPPQLTVVTRDTDLVTLGIGGNDEQLFFGLITRCAQPQSTCEGFRDPAGADYVRGIIARTGLSVADVVGRIKKRAPRAQVLVVTYPALLPDGQCPEDSPYAGADYSYAAGINRSLSEAIASGARSAGAGVIDVFGPSRGHEICSDDPWVNGMTTDPARALAFHPFAAEQLAVARLILRRVGAS